ncbi:peptide-methionine (S)-S-oxide reductase MsrA [Salipaludibacillus sp. CF4.18]|uniref:peptide-methionine (S)-S-oxide reductase MsrA n=1 Tax=Salipaludibacillus sp. CF4.18 TaxID=3373081 RepID=UPI003EE6468A
MKNTYKKATFAGGCFWCMVKPFDELPGIEKVVSGYTGGSVSNGETGHYEAIQITYDPSLFTYETLLNLYWPQIDPTDDGGQFFDRGSQYRTAIFYHDEEQKMLAEKSLAKIEQTSRFKAPIVTKVLSASFFYEAEEEHQKFYKKEPERYEQEREESGRKKFIEENWKSKV